MKAKDLAALLALSAVWGGAFLFMRVAAPVLGPILLIELRVGLAGLVLLGYARFSKIDLKLKTHWKHYLVIGIMNSAIPFTLIATAELQLTAGFAAILNATSPLFGALVAAIWIKEALTIKKLVGLFLGLLGVGVLVGWSPLSFSTLLLLSIAASLAGAIFYGFSGVYIKIFTQGVPPLALATCSQLAAALFLLPVTPFVLPATFPDWTVVLAVAALALFSTAFAFLLYFGLIKNVGPTRALTVTFLAPIFGVIWGALLLGEAVTLSTLVGFAIILSGTGFVTGLSFRRKKVLQKAPQPLVRQ